MTDYTELVKALTCGNDGKLPCHNNECPYWVDQWHGIGLCNVIKKDADAAAAIEDMAKHITDQLKRKDGDGVTQFCGLYVIIAMSLVILIEIGLAISWIVNN